MKVIFITTPAYGHINPMIALARELIARGHEVRMYANPSFQSAIETAGINFVAHPEIDESQMHLKNAVTSVAKLLQDGMETLLPFFLSEFAKDPPDLVVRDIAAFWGKLVEDKTGIKQLYRSQYC